MSIPVWQWKSIEGNSNNSDTQNLKIDDHCSPAIALNSSQISMRDRSASDCVCVSQVKYWIWEVDEEVFNFGKQLAMMRPILAILQNVLREK